MSANVNNTSMKAVRSGSNQVTLSAAAVSTWTIPSPTSTFVGTALTQAISNKTITSSTYNGLTVTTTTGTLTLGSFTADFGANFTSAGAINIGNTFDTTAAVSMTGAFTTNGTVNINGSFNTSGLVSIGANFMTSGAVNIGSTFDTVGAVSFADAFSTVGAFAGIITATGAWNGTVPTGTFDFADKAWVENLVTIGTKWNIATQVATTANITIATDTVAGQIIDGYTLVAGDRILVKDQTTASQNGIYEVQIAGAATRPPDFDGTPTNEVVEGDAVLVIGGDTNAGTTWAVNTPGTIIVGTDPINWVLLSTTLNYVGDNGIDITGSTISLATNTAIANWNFSNTYGIKANGIEIGYTANTIGGVTSIVRLGGGTWSLPAATDTFVGIDTVDTLFGKTMIFASSLPLINPNTLEIGDITVIGVTGTGGNLVYATSPTLVTPNIGAATATSINGITIASGSGSIDIGANTIAFGGNFSTAGNVAFTGANNISIATSGNHTYTLQNASGTLAFLADVNLHTVTTFGAGNHALTATDDIVILTAITGGGDTVTLPSAAATPIGTLITIKDASFTANTNNITIDEATGGNVDGVPSIIADADGFSVTVVCDGTAWWIID